MKSRGSVWFALLVLQPMVQTSLVPPEDNPTDNSFQISSISKDLAANLDETFSLECCTNVAWDYCGWELPDGSRCDLLKTSQYDSLCQDERIIMHKNDIRTINDIRGHSQTCCSVTIYRPTLDDSGKWLCSLKDDVLHGTIKKAPTQVLIGAPIDLTVYREESLNSTDLLDEVVVCEASGTGPVEATLSWITKIQGNSVTFFDSIREPIAGNNEDGSWIRRSKVKQPIGNGQKISCLSRQFFPNGSVWFENVQHWKSLDRTDLGRVGHMGDSASQVAKTSVSGHIMAGLVVIGVTAAIGLICYAQKTKTMCYKSNRPSHRAPDESETITIEDVSQRSPPPSAPLPPPESTESRLRPNGTEPNPSQTSPHVDSTDLSTVGTSEEEPAPPLASEVISFSRGQISPPLSIGSGPSSIEPSRNKANPRNRRLQLQREVTSFDHGLIPETGSTDPLISRQISYPQGIDHTNIERDPLGFVVASNPNLDGPSRPMELYDHFNSSTDFPDSKNLSSGSLFKRYADLISAPPASSSTSYSFDEVDMNANGQQQYPITSSDPRAKKKALISTRTVPNLELKTQGRSNPYESVAFHREE